jgi:glycosyltransferase involved in cell wall biosynthesis
MQKKKLVYIANARLPTEKAHGYQVSKMCEALALNDADVVLLHPRRHQAEHVQHGRTVFDYYGIRPVFTVRTLANWDVVPLSLRMPQQWFPPLFFAHAMVWGLYAALCARRERADLYYTRESQAAFWLLRMGMPTVYEVHVIPKRGQRWLLQMIARHPALKLVVVLTSFIQERLIAMGFPAAKVQVLPDAVDLSLFKNLPCQDECRRRLGLPLDRSIIGYIGRFRTLEMEKGIPELIQALPSLRACNGKDLLLLCVGGPMDAVPAYMDLACRVGLPEHRLRFIDHVPSQEVPFWMRACDIGTIPWPWTEFSAYFTSPMKLFEYMAAGVPIVATDLPSLREVLRHGENAWLVEPGNPKAIAEAIDQLLREPHVGMLLANNARGSATSYSWDNRARAILKAIDDNQNIFSSDV